MKKLFFYSAVTVFILSCNQEPKTTEAAPAKAADVKALYEKNLETIKAGIAAIENENIEAWANNVADSVVFSSPMYGDTITTKQHWKDFISGFLADWDNLKLVNPIFLPGVDSATHEPDGSVRYYGSWTGVHKSGKHTSFKFYGAFEFNTDAKIINADEYFDVGDVLASVNTK